MVTKVYRPPSGAVSGWQSTQDFADELALGYGAHNLYPVVDDGFGHVHHGIRLRETRELVGLDHVGRDPLAGQRHPVGQTGHLGTVRSGGGDEHLEMEPFIGVGQRRLEPLQGGGTQRRRALRDGDDRVHQRRKLVAGR